MMTLPARFSLQFSISLTFLVGLAALANAAARGRGAALEVSPVIWLSFGFLAASPFISYLYSRFGELIRACYRSPARMSWHGERFRSKQEFLERLYGLVVGSQELCVFDLSTPDAGDEETHQFLDRMRRYLKRPDATVMRYRRISCVGGDQDMRSTLHTLERFRGLRQIEHLCVERQASLECHLSFFLVKRKEGSHVFFFDAGKMDVILVHDDSVGGYVEEEFERLWSSIEQQQETILQNGEIRQPIVERLAKRYRCRDSWAYRRLFAPRWLRLLRPA